MREMCSVCKHYIPNLISNLVVFVWVNEWMKECVRACVLRIRGVCVNECFALVMCCCCCCLCSRSRSETKYIYSRYIFERPIRPTCDVEISQKLYVGSVCTRLPINLLFTYIYSRIHTLRVCILRSINALCFAQALNFYLIGPSNYEFHSLFPILHELFL